MPTTLTYTRQKPIQGEKGDTVFDALENNIDVNDAHSHNGVNSARLDPAEFSPQTSELAAGSWVLTSGKYQQTLALPAVYTTSPNNRDIKNVQVQFFELNTGTGAFIAQIYPEVLIGADDEEYYVRLIVDNKRVLAVFN